MLLTFLRAIAVRAQQVVPTHGERDQHRILGVVDLRQLFTEDAWTDAMFWSELAERDSRHYVVAAADDDLAGYAGLCAYASGEAYVQTKDDQGGRAEAERALVLAPASAEAKSLLERASR